MVRAGSGLTLPSFVLPHHYKTSIPQLHALKMALPKGFNNEKGEANPSCCFLLLFSPPHPLFG
jgi:hypothetical protein